ncbi:MAG: hypothetical protein K1X75_10105 [Leptospirales bacterium]|nr:hypothetical protein [Leptospirales bacterium]
MGGLSDKVKIVYLTAVILFSMGVFAYLLDTWGIINLEEYLPGMSETADQVSFEEDSVSELDRQQLDKERARIEEERIKLEEERLALQEKQAELDRKQQELQERVRGVEAQQKALQEDAVAQQDRKRMIAQMADRMGNMPPPQAVAIVAGWSNTDLVDVFLEMERSAADAGRTSLVPYLLTLLPKERAAMITTLMMDERARSLPE